jgi:DNA invertase Pin-like site-specific DNA recombinase
MTTNDNLRAAGYCRTSGETQRDNTSIANQQEDIDRFVKSQGWNLVKFYVDECKSGAKIAGRDEFQQMMRDAANSRFDIIVPWDMTRFGRDGRDILNSAETLKRDFGVDVVDTKGRFDTRDRRRILTNFVDAGMAESERLSILERTKKGKIKKARQGAPMSGMLPFGRIWNKKDQVWTIDQTKHAIVQDSARRYLQGESIKSLAREYNLDPSNLHQVLTRRCGPTWTQRIRCPELDIDETIETAIPPLLDPAVIAAILAKAQANKTIDKTQLIHKYLLGHAVFCAHCNSALTGQFNNGYRYYRHHQLCEAGRRRSWVEADALEQTVLFNLFDVFGNPAKVQAAIDAAAPDKQKTQEARDRQQRLHADLARIETQRDRLIDAITEGTVSKSQARSKMDELNSREQHLADELDKTAEILANIPSADERKGIAHSIVRAATRAVANRQFDRMSWQEQRTLVQMVLGGKSPDGKRHGVYISWVDGQENKRKRKWGYRIEGRLNLAMKGKVPADPVADDWEPSGAPLQDELLRSCLSSF